MSRLLCFSLACVLMAGPVAFADVDFYRDVFPILKANCLSCHNKTTTESSLNLESPETIRNGGDSGPGVMPGNAEKSLIYRASVQDGDFVMPPENNNVGASKLKPAELKTLADWINAGAKDSVQVGQEVIWRPLSAKVQPIYSIAVSRDGRWAACGRGDQVAVYDLATRQLAAVLTDSALSSPGGKPRSHRGLISSLAMSPDGSRIASGGFREVKLWRKQTSPVKHTPFELKQQATGFAISPNGLQLAVWDKEPQIQVQELSTGKQSAAFTLPAPAIAAAWTANQTELLVVGEDRLIRRWSTATSAAVDPDWQLALPPDLPLPLELHVLKEPDRLLVGSADGRISVWSLADGKQVQSLQIPGAKTYSVTPQGTWLAAGCTDGTVKVWDLPAGKLQTELKGDLPSRELVADINWRLASHILQQEHHQSEVTRLTAAIAALDAVQKKAEDTIATANKVLPERRQALTAAVTVREMAEKEVARLTEQMGKLGEDAKQREELSSQLSPKQQALMKALEQEAEAQKNVRISENHLADATSEVARSMDSKQKFAALIDEAKAAIESETKAVAAARTEQQRRQAAVEAPKHPLLAVAISADHQVVAAVDQNGDLRLWARASGEPIGFVAGTMPIQVASAVSPADGKFLVYSPGRLTVWQSSGSWELEHILGGDSQPPAFADRVNALKFSPDGKLLASGGGELSRSGEISLWEISSRTRVAHWHDHHADTVLCLDFSADGALLASGSADRLVKLTDVASGELKETFEGHTHHALGVTFRADGRRLASAGADNAVLVWNLQTGELSKKVTGWKKEVSAVQFLGATNQLATSAGDGQVRVINDVGSQVRSSASIPSYLHALATDASGSVVATGGEDGVLHITVTADGKTAASFHLAP